MAAVSAFWSLGTVKASASFAAVGFTRFQIEYRAGRNRRISAVPAAVPPMSV
jgi:hypothetical protein